MGEVNVTKQKQQQQQQPGGAMLHSSSSSSSSSRRQDPPTEIHRASAVGCMSGILRLFSNHHSTRRKRLTLGKTDETGSRTIKKESEQRRGTTEVDGRISIESPRGPTPTQETEACGRSSSVATEKRMMLLGALAKCDEDLRELKKMIEELKSDSIALKKNDLVKVELMPVIGKDMLVTELSSGEQPSPISVLDELIRSPPFSRSAKRMSSQYVKIKQEQQQIKRKHAEEFIMTSQHLKGIQRAAQHVAKNLSSSPLSCSRAMVETVEKACGEIAWGEKRERGMIGMALQEQIYRDLIEETVTEVMEFGKLSVALHQKLCYTYGKLHGGGCRRRLSY